MRTTLDWFTDNHHDKFTGLGLFGRVDTGSQIHVMLDRLASPLVISGQPKKDATTFFFLPTLHPLSPVIFATATVVALVLLRNSRFSFHCYTQREATPTQKSARKWRCDLSRLLTRKITKGIHSCKPASLNRPIAELCQGFLMVGPVKTRISETPAVTLIPGHNCRALSEVHYCDRHHQHVTVITSMWPSSPACDRLQPEWREL